MKVVELKALAKKHELRGYSRLKKAKLITFLQNNLPAPCTKPPRPPPPPPTWGPINDIPRPTPKPRPIPSLRPIPASRPIPPPRPYQLRPKRGKVTSIEPPVEQPPSNSNNKTNDLILNLTPENVTQHSRIVTTTHKGSSTPTKMSKIIGRQIR